MRTCDLLDANCIPLTPLLPLSRLLSDLALFCPLESHSPLPLLPPSIISGPSKTRFPPYMLFF